MRKQDLQKALGHIRPDEELICRTLQKIEDTRRAAVKTAPSPYAFTRRLASALCALALVLGLGIALGNNPAISPLRRAGGDGPDPVAYTTEGPSKGTGAAALLSRAAASGEDYLVMEADLAACLLSGDTQNNGATLYRMQLVLFPTQTLGTRLSDGVTLPEPAADGSIRVDRYVDTPAEQAMQAGAVGARVTLWLSPDPAGQFVVLDMTWPTTTP